MMKFNDNKAGMTGLDKEKIERIIEENSNGNFRAFAEKKEIRKEMQCKEIREKIAKQTVAEQIASERQMAEMCASLETTRDLSRHCVHIDMDAFFAAVEMRDEPRLRSIPMAVGSSAMLSTSNYPARQFGVRAAMPGFIAMKLCPQLEIVPGNFDKYGKESNAFFEVFAEYDPRVTRGSLDEAYIDITDYMRSRNRYRVLPRVRYAGICICRLPRAEKDDPPAYEGCKKCKNVREVIEDKVQFGCSRDEVVREIRFRVQQRTGLTCSAGIAPNFMIAKICSDKNKPNGQFELPNDLNAVSEFMTDLPVRKVCGIGPVMEGELSAVGVATCGDIISLRHRLPLAFSPVGLDFLLRVGLGLGSSSHSTPSEDSAPRKQISTERSFSPTADGPTLHAKLRDMCKNLAMDVSASSSKIISAGGLAVKWKLATFEVVTRAAIIPSYVNLLDENVIYRFAKPVLDKQLKSREEIRLLGVRLYKLSFEGQKNEGDMLQKWLLSAPRSEAEPEEGADTLVLEDETASAVGEEENPDVEMEQEWPQCPVCYRNIPSLDEREINRHVDECLNRETVEEMMQMDQIPPPRVTTPSSRPATPSSRTSSATKKKANTNTNQPPPKKPRTLDTFFPKNP